MQCLDGAQGWRSYEALLLDDSATDELLEAVEARVQSTLAKLHAMQDGEGNCMVWGDARPPNIMVKWWVTSPGWLLAITMHCHLHCLVCDKNHAGNLHSLAQQLSRPRAEEHHG